MSDHCGKEVRKAALIIIMRDPSDLTYTEKDLGKKRMMCDVKDGTHDGVACQQFLGVEHPGQCLPQP
jgi:hypothetical protein